MKWFFVIFFSFFFVKFDLPLRSKVYKNRKFSPTQNPSIWGSHPELPEDFEASSPDEQFCDYEGNPHHWEFEAWDPKLPKEFFKSSTVEKGLIIPWCGLGINLAGDIFSSRYPSLHGYVRKWGVKTFLGLAFVHAWYPTI